MPRVNRLFSDLVSSARLWHQATPTQVAAMLNIPSATVVAVERGECAPPMQIPLVERWASVFSLDTDLIMRAAMMAWDKVELPLDLDQVGSARNALALRLACDWPSLTEEQCRAALLAIAPSESVVELTPGEIMRRAMVADAMEPLGA